MQTKQLADFARELSYEDMSPHAIHMTKMCIEDLIGVALAGSTTEQGKLWQKYFLTDAPAGRSPVWQKDFPRTNYRNAAALNAACGHLLDLDDVHNRSIVHLGSITIPAALALGAHLHASGSQVIAAIAAGYEVGARIGQALNPDSYYYWHTTAVVGSFASAAVAGKLLALTPEQYLHAFGSAGTQSAGLWEFLADGAMSKALHTANATLCGLRAAELAQLGITGASCILEGERGLLRALTQTCRPEILTDGLDPQQLAIEQNSFKPYACCRHIHSGNYAMQSLRGQLRPEDVVSITDRTYALAVQTVDCPHPQTPYAYKFSAQYCLAAMLLYGDLMPDAFTEEAIARPGIRELMDKITVVVDQEAEQEYQADHNCWTHILEIRCSNGQTLRKKVTYPLGDSQNPFDRQTMDHKFHTLTAGILPFGEADMLCRRIGSMEELPDVSRLFSPN